MWWNILLYLVEETSSIFWNIVVFRIFRLNRPFCPSLLRSTWSVPSCLCLFFSLSLLLSCHFNLKPGLYFLQGWISFHSFCLSGSIFIPQPWIAFLQGWIYFHSFCLSRIIFIPRPWKYFPQGWISFYSSYLSGIISSLDHVKTSRRVEFPVTLSVF